MKVLQVTNSRSGSEAQRAGIVLNDIIKEYDGVELNGEYDKFVSLVAASEAKQIVPFTIIRHNKPIELIAKGGNLGVEVKVVDWANQDSGITAALRNSELQLAVGKESSSEQTTRHNSVKFLARFANLIGWIFVISIIGIPIGVSLLLFGHMALAAIETEHNTRVSADYLKQIMQESPNH